MTGNSMLTISREEMPGANIDRHAISSCAAPPRKGYACVAWLTSRPLSLNQIYINKCERQAA